MGCPTKKECAFRQRCISRCVEIMKHPRPQPDQRVPRDGYAQSELGTTGQPLQQLDASAHALSEIQLSQMLASLEYVPSRSAVSSQLSVQLETSMLVTH